MLLNFRNSFKKDLRKINDKKLLSKIRQIILNLENVIENTETEIITQIPNLKKMSGYDNKYRIRLGDYRIGITIEKTNNNDIIWFERFIHRKDIYKYFP